MQPEVRNRVAPARPPVEGVSATCEPTGVVLSRWTDAGSPLTPAEHSRWVELRRPGDQDDYLAAHLLCREVAAAVIGAMPAALRLHYRCPDCGSRHHGRPAVQGAPHVHVSLSHTGGYVAAAAADAPVGVDVERYDHLNRHRSAVADLLRDEVSAEAPTRALTEAWVLHEARVKLGERRLDAPRGHRCCSGPAVDTFVFLHQDGQAAWGLALQRIASLVATGARRPAACHHGLSHQPTSPIATSATHHLTTWLTQPVNPRWAHREGSSP